MAGLASQGVTRVPTSRGIIPTAVRAQIEEAGKNIFFKAITINGPNKNTYFIVPKLRRLFLSAIFNYSAQLLAGLRWSASTTVAYWSLLGAQVWAMTAIYRVYAEAAVFCGVDFD
jgi:hypothetical protein